MVYPVRRHAVTRVCLGLDVFFRRKANNEKGCGEGGMDGHSARSSSRARVVMLMAAFAGAAGCPGTATSADNEHANLEYRVKAAFLYKIAQYVEWPNASFPQPDTPLTIGVVGSEPLATELSQILTGRTAHDRPLRVRRLKASEPLEGVHVLFLGRKEIGQLDQLALKAQQRSILVATESEGALARGSVINFVIKEGRVRFEVSLASAKKSNVKLSSRLLAVAYQVTGAP
jgi:hypothetical protein